MTGIPDIIAIKHTDDLVVCSTAEGKIPRQKIDNTTERHKEASTVSIADSARDGTMNRGKDRTDESRRDDIVKMGKVSTAERGRDGNTEMCKVSAKDGISNVGLEITEKRLSIQRSFTEESNNYGNL